MKNIKKLLSIMVIALLVVTSIPIKAEAAVKISATKKTLTVGKSATIKITGTKKSVKWSVSNEHIRITKKTKKSAKIKAVSSGISYLYAKQGKKTYSCMVFVKEKSSTTQVTPKPTDKPEENEDYVSDFSISQKEIYNGNGVSISTGNVEKTSKGVSIEFICLSNSDKDYSISAHEYAVNNLMAGDHLYGSDVDLPAGKKATFTISIDSEWFKNNGIKEFKKLDVMFWAYYDNFKEWESEKISISTSKDNGAGYYTPSGKQIYSDSNMELYYLSNNKNTYQFCIKNNTQLEKRWSVENCSINDWSYDLGSCMLDLYSEPLLNGCYTIFDLVVDEDFLQSNSISSIKNIEFDIEFGHDIKSEKIKLYL